MQELTINYQATRGLLENQNRCTFSLPKYCTLDKLEIIGPEDQEEDLDEEGEFSMTTNVDIEEVVNKCKVMTVIGDDAKTLFDFLAFFLPVDLLFLH
jgi:hypothetical protein